MTALQFTPVSGRIWRREWQADEKFRRTRGSDPHSRRAAGGPRYHQALSRPHLLRSGIEPRPGRPFAERVAAAFPEATLGRWHDALVGPHLQSMYQIAFPRTLLASFLPWLMLNRDGLTILLHPGTGDAYADHTDHAVWLGGMLPLRLDVLRAATEHRPPGQPE